MNVLIWIGAFGLLAVSVFKFTLSMWEIYQEPIDD